MASAEGDGAADAGADAGADTGADTGADAAAEGATDGAGVAPLAHADAVKLRIASRATSRCLFAMRDLLLDPRGWPPPAVEAIEPLRGASHLPPSTGG